jgi:hypothetical protein
MLLVHGATGGFVRKHAKDSTASALVQPRDAKILTTPSLGAAGIEHCGILGCFPSLRWCEKRCM